MVFFISFFSLCVVYVGVHMYVRVSVPCVHVQRGQTLKSDVFLYHLPL